MFNITANKCRDITTAAKAQPLNEHLFDSTDLSIIADSLEEQIRMNAYFGSDSTTATIQCVDEETARNFFYTEKSEYFVDEGVGRFVYSPRFLAKLGVTVDGLADMIKRLFEQKLSIAGFDARGECFTDESFKLPIPSFKMTISW